MKEARRATDEARQKVEQLKAELGVADEGALATSLRDASREASQLEAKLSKTETQKSAIAEQMDAAEPAILKTEQHLRDLEGLLRELEGVDPSNAEEWHGAHREIGGVKQAIEETRAELDAQLQAQDALNDKWQGLDDKASGYAAKLEEATARQAELSDQSARMGEATQAVREAEREQGKLERKWQATNEQVERYQSQLRSATARQKELGAEYGRSYSQAARR